MQPEGEARRGGRTAPTGAYLAQVPPWVCLTLYAPAAFLPAPAYIHCKSGLSHCHDVLHAVVGRPGRGSDTLARRPTAIRVRAHLDNTRHCSNDFMLCTYRNHPEIRPESRVKRYSARSRAHAVLSCTCLARNGGAGAERRIRPPSFARRRNCRDTTGRGHCPPERSACRRLKRLASKARRSSGRISW